MDDEDYVMVETPNRAVSNNVANDTPELLDEISNFIDETAEELWAINKYIHDNPELGFEEYKAHALLTEFLKARGGWKVTPSAYGMATAWVAVYDSGRKGPVVSFNVEMGTSSHTFLSPP